MPINNIHKGVKLKWDHWGGDFFLYNYQRFTIVLLDVTLVSYGGQLQAMIKGRGFCILKEFTWNSFDVQLQMITDVISESTLLLNIPRFCYCRLQLLLPQIQFNPPKRGT